MVPTCCEINSQSPWVTPSGLSIEIRTKRLLAAALDFDLDDFHALRTRPRAGRFPRFWTLPLPASFTKCRDPTKKWAFAHSFGSTTQTTLYRVYAEEEGGNLGSPAGAFPHVRPPPELLTITEIALSRSPPFRAVAGRTEHYRYAGGIGGRAGAWGLRLNMLIDRLRGELHAHAAAQRRQRVHHAAARFAEAFHVGRAAFR